MASKQCKLQLLSFRYEEKLTQQEEEHEQEISELKSKYDKEKDELHDIICEKKNACDTLDREKKKSDQEKQDLMKQRNKAIEDLEKIKATCEDLNKKIELQEKEKRQNQESLKQKEHDLYKYKFKIKDLQKSKHVLTHRATEMRASLEPKEQQIESLKEQILQLEKVFEQQMKSISESKKDLEKKQFKITQLTKDLNKKKAEADEKDKTIFKIITDIHNYVQSKDEKSYAAGLMKLNQDYVTPRAGELLEKKKKDPETIEELDRQLRYMERSITQLKINTMKNENRTRLHIKKKTSENTKLIKELNDLKIDKKELIGTNKRLKESVRNLEEKIKRVKGRDEVGEFGPPGSVQSMTHKMGHEESIPSLVAGRPQSVKKQSKGKLYKGTPYQFRKTNLEDKAKISELTAQLEDTQQMVMIQKLEIRSLKEKFISLVKDRNRLLGQVEASGSQMEGEHNPNMMTPENDDGFLPRVEHKS